MNEYSINLPKSDDMLFQYLGERQDAKACVSSSLGSQTNYTVKVVSVSGSRMHISICTPRGDHSKTVSVERRLINNTLVLDVLYYGTLDVNQVRALCACARNYGCDRITIGRDSLSSVGSW